MTTTCRVPAALRLRTHLLGIVARVPDLDLQNARRAWALLALAKRRFLRGVSDSWSALLMLFLAFRPAELRHRSEFQDELRTKPTPPRSATSEAVLETVPLPVALFRFELPLPPPGLDLGSAPEPERRGEKVRLAQRLHASGMSWRAVSQEVGVPASTLRAWVRKASTQESLT